MFAVFPHFPARRPRLTAHSVCFYKKNPADICCIGMPLDGNFRFGDNPGRNGIGTLDMGSDGESGGEGIH
jgi:hypothetical protein